MAGLSLRNREVGSVDLAGGETKRTPLYRLHVELGAKMVPFAGYQMPLQFPQGIIAEHLHARSRAALFDVSHMGQIKLHGGGARSALERQVPSDIVGLAPGSMRYTVFTNDSGGILDDLMVANGGDHVFLVVNAARKKADSAHLLNGLAGTGVGLEELSDQAFLAIQGPEAAAVLARHAPHCTNLRFMRFAAMEIAGIACTVTRSGYTGEDGFEVSLPAERAEDLARSLLREPEVAPAGLGARDSLRLEAGLCLHGHDIDETTTPVEARLRWTIAKHRRVKGEFPGAHVIVRHMAGGPPRLRVGFRLDGRAPAREHAPISSLDGRSIGTVTSGGYGPSVGGPIAMGYVPADHATVGTQVNLMVRDKPRPARVVRLPFVPHRYHKT